MKIVRVYLGERSYEIKIGLNIRVAESLCIGSGARALIISDSNVDKFYGDKYDKVFQVLGLKISRAIIPAGEKSKNLDNIKNLYEKALDFDLDRSSIIIALGGGVVGDIAGFVAATFLRGVRLFQIPTSLLAMVDSSVGGKTGVNLTRGKNLVGSFYQPVEVIADLSTLETLPDREYISGLSEIVKYGIIWDAILFSKIEKNVDRLKNRDIGILEEIVARCCEIKAEVVAIDERESGIRAILNFGHTFGHAIEKVSGYGRWLHGEAVAVGMVYAARLSVKEKRFALEDCDRLINLLRVLGLPTEVPDTKELSLLDLREAMITDKKSLNSVPRFVLIDKVGSTIQGCEVSECSMEKSFGELQCLQ